MNTQESEHVFNGHPIVRVPMPLMLIMAVLLFGCAIVLLQKELRTFTAAAYMLVALGASVITFGCLGASGVVRSREKQIGGSLAGLIVVFSVLAPFIPKEAPTVHYPDPGPSKQAEVLPRPQLSLHNLDGLMSEFGALTARNAEVKRPQEIVAWFEASRLALEQLTRGTDLEWKLDNIARQVNDIASDGDPEIRILCALDIWDSLESMRDILRGMK